MAYGTPGHAEDVEAYYTDIRRGRPPTPEQLADLGGPLRRHRGPLAARRADRGPARRPAVGARRASSRDLSRWCSGMKHAEPDDRGGGRPAWRRGLPRGRRARARAPLLGVQRRPVPRARVRCRARRAASRCLGIDALGHLLACTSSSRRPAFATAWPACLRARRSCSPPTASPSGSSPPVTPTRTSSGRRRGVGGQPPGWPPRTAWGLAWQSAGRTPEPWLGPDMLAVIDELAASEGAPACWCAPAASWPTTSRCSTTSTSRPAGEPRPRAGLRPHTVRERRPGGDRRARRPRDPPPPAR